MVYHFETVTALAASGIPLLRRVSAGRGVLFKIYDILRQEVVTIINEQFQHGTYEVEFNASNYPSAAYYYTLSSGDLTSTKKMILLK